MAEESRDYWRVHLDGRINLKMFGVLFKDVWIYYNVPFSANLTRYQENLNYKTESCVARDASDPTETIPCEDLQP